MARYFVAVAKGRKYGPGKTRFRTFKSLPNAKSFAKKEVEKGNSIDIDKETTDGILNLMQKKGVKKEKKKKG